MSLKDHPFVIVSGVAIAAFTAGWGANYAIEKRAGLVTVPSVEIDSLRNNSVRLGAAIDGTAGEALV